MSQAFLVENLWKKYGYRNALSGIDLEISAGECLAILGPNGAGKSTLLRVLATRSSPTSGRVSVLGQDVSKRATQLREKIGVVFHEPCLRHDLSLIQNLQFFAGLYPNCRVDERALSLIETVGLADRQHDPVRDFSRGMMQRATLVRSLLHDPSIWLLDEPFTGLDPEGQRMLETLLVEEHQSGRTIVFVSHDVDQSLRVAKRVVVIDDGELRAEGEEAVRAHFGVSGGKENV